LLNSRLGLFTAALEGLHPQEHPFSRSYGVILPSSLTRVLSHTLGFSPRLPVSVCGTGTSRLARGFSWQCEIRNFALKELAITAQRYRKRICLLPRLTAWTRTTNGALTLSYCVPPLLKRRGGGTGISTCCPSSTPIGLDLGPD
jgi:hypothetical protein